MMKFVDEAVLSLIEAVSTLSLISSSVRCSYTVCNCSFENNLCIDCVCYDANIIFFDITLINKKKY